MLAARVPHERRAARKTFVLYAIGDSRSALGGLPLLEQQNWWSVDRDQRKDQVLDNVRRQRVRNVSDPCFLGFVDAVRTRGAYPLCPAMQHEVTVVDRFFTGKARIAHEEEVRLKPMVREGFGEARNSFAQATDARIAIGALE